jgi:hypothetical protein
MQHKSQEDVRVINPTTKINLNNINKRIENNNWTEVVLNSIRMSLETLG